MLIVYIEVQRLLHCTYTKLYLLILDDVDVEQIYERRTQASARLLVHFDNIYV